MSAARCAQGAWSKETVMAMNINKAVDKGYEGKSFKEIADAPVSALAGITDETGQKFAALGIKTIRDLADYKYAAWARAIVELAKVEG